LLIKCHQLIQNSRVSSDANAPCTMSTTIQDTSITRQNYEPEGQLHRLTRYAVCTLRAQTLHIKRCTIHNSGILCRECCRTKPSTLLHSAPYCCHHAFHLARFSAIAHRRLLLTTLPCKHTARAGTGMHSSKDTSCAKTFQNPCLCSKTLYCHPPFLCLNPTHPHQPTSQPNSTSSTSLTPMHTRHADSQLAPEQTRTTPCLLLLLLLPLRQQQPRDAALPAAAAAAAALRCTPYTTSKQHLGC
jgi:hypothetical protein